MDDYVLRKSVYDALCRICNERGACDYTGQENCHKVFSQIPAANVRENVRGVWITYNALVNGMYLDENERHSCSVCKHNFRNQYNFCPNCGADMRGEKNCGSG